MEFNYPWMTINFQKSFPTPLDFEDFLKRTEPLVNNIDPFINYLTDFITKERNFRKRAQLSANPFKMPFAKKQSPLNNKQRSYKRKNPDGNRKPVVANKRVINENEKVDSLLRCKLMCRTKAEIARELNVPESTLRGWFKNEKIINKADAFYKSLKINWPLIAGKADSVFGGRRNRHKQPNPKKLRNKPKVMVPDFQSLATIDGAANKATSTDTAGSAAATGTVATGRTNIRPAHIVTKTPLYLLMAPFPNPSNIMYQNFTVAHYNAIPPCHGYPSMTGPKPARCEPFDNPLDLSAHSSNKRY